MTDEQIKQKFKETYPDFMRGDEPLSPYFDIWEYAIEIVAEENAELENIINSHEYYKNGYKAGRQDEKEKQQRSKLRKNHWYEMYELECLKTKELEKQTERMRQELSKVKNDYDKSKDKTPVSMFGAEYRLFCDIEKLLDKWETEAEQFLSEVKNV